MWLTGLAAPRHVGSSQTRAQTRVPCIGRQTLNHCMWDLPRPGLKPVSPALAGRLSTTVPPGKPFIYFLSHFLLRKFAYILLGLEYMHTFETCFNRFLVSLNIHQNIVFNGCIVICVILPSFILFFLSSYGAQSQSPHDSHLPFVFP